MAARATTTPRAARTTRRMTESQLRDAVVALARLSGWMAYWTFNSKRSPPGFPDLVLCHPAGRLLFAELKVQGRPPTAAQREWLAQLAGVRGVRVFLWTDADWLDGTIERELRR